MPVIFDEVVGEVASDSTQAPQQQQEQASPPQAEQNFVGLSRELLRLERRAARLYAD